MAACNAEKVFSARIAASLVYGKDIIVSKHNESKTHPFQKRFSHHEEAIHLHAENNCIISAIRKGFDINLLKYCSLYVARATMIGGKFLYGYVKPCTGCQSCLSTYKIKNVFYTTTNGIACL